MRGGWYFGIPTSAHLKRTLHTAVQRGYAFASIACTSSRYQKFPYQIWEVKTAIRYLRANAETYRLDPDRIALWSASSGAGHSDPIFKTEATCHRILDTIDQWLATTAKC